MLNTHFLTSLTTAMLGPWAYLTGQFASDED
jgi:hypothetical protein